LVMQNAVGASWRLGSRSLWPSWRELEHRIPFDSGCDNQDPSAELHLGLEDLLGMHSAITINTTTVNASQAASRVRDKENPETLRRA
jgi:hypothetical protein